MLRRIFEQIDIPIDTDIPWRINTFNTGSDTEAHGCLGVCHAVPIDIGGVKVQVPIVIVEEWNQDRAHGSEWREPHLHMKTMGIASAGSNPQTGIGLFNSSPLSVIIIAIYPSRGVSMDHLKGQGILPSM